jgi:hypothetical protein
MIDRIWFWYLALAIWLGFIAAVCLLPIGHAATLSISGSAIGNGQHYTDLELPDISGLTFNEARYLLGPGHNFNVSESGLVTFSNGSSYQIIDLSWNVTGAF